MADIDFQPQSGTPDSNSTLDFRPSDSAQSSIDFKPSVQPAQSSPVLDFRPQSQTAQTTGQPVNAEKIVSETAPSTRYGGISREITERSGLYDRPAVLPEPVKDEELQAIADKYKVPVQKLRDYLPYVGRPEKLSPGVGGAVKDIAKETAGVAGGIFAGLPQKALRVAQSIHDPALAGALDEVTDLAEGRKSYVQKAAEFTAPVGLAGDVIRGGQATGLLGRVLTGAGVGAGYAVGGSRTGEEGKAAVVGGALGAGLTTIPSIAKTVSGIAKGEISVFGKILGKGAITAEEQPEIIKGAAQIADSRKVADNTILRSISGEDSASISPEEIQETIKKYHSPEELSKLMDSSSLEGEAVAKATGSDSEEDMMREIFKRDVEDRTVDIAKLIDPAVRSPEKAAEIIAEHTKSSGGIKELDRLNQRVIERDSAEQYILDNGIGGLNKGLIGSTVDRGIQKFSAPQWVLRGVDDRAGTDLLPLHQELNGNIGQMTHASSILKKGIVDIHSALNKSIDNPEEMQKISQAAFNLEKEDDSLFNSLNDSEKTVLSRAHDYINSVRDYANGGVSDIHPDITPLSIQENKNQILPHILIGPDKIAVGLENRESAVADEATRVVGEKISNIAQLGPQQYSNILENTKSGQDLVNSMRALNIDITKMSPGEAANTIKNTIGQGYQVGNEYRKSSANINPSDIPNWMLEKNVFKIMNGYTDSTLKNLYLRDTSEKLMDRAKILDSVNMTQESGYVRNLVRDIMSTDNSSPGAISRSIGKGYNTILNKMIDQAPNDIIKSGLQTAKAIPDAMSYMTKQIFPNALGMRVKPIIVHLLQPFTRAAPEISGTYGGTVLLRSGARLLNPAIRQDLFNLQNELGVGVHGLSAEDANLRRVLSEGLAQSPLVQAGTKAVDAATNSLMYLFRRGLDTSKLITTSMGKTWAEDISVGDKSALDALSRAPKSIQEAVRQAGSKEDIQKIIIRHLNASSQYNYNRASMSEFGRWAGPLFSQFTKIPTEIGGQLVAETMANRPMSQSVSRLAQLYVVPYVLLSTVDHVIGLHTDQTMPDKLSGYQPTEPGDRTRMVVGRAGLAGMSPIQEINPLEAYSRGPITSDIKDLISGTASFINGESDNRSDILYRGFSKSLEHYAPVGWVRFLTDDLVTYINGQRPEGKNFLERTQSGINQLTPTNK